MASHVGFLLAAQPSKPWHLVVPIYISISVCVSFSSCFLGSASRARPCLALSFPAPSHVFAVGVSLSHLSPPFSATMYLSFASCRSLPHVRLWSSSSCHLSVCLSVPFCSVCVYLDGGGLVPCQSCNSLQKAVIKAKRSPSRRLGRHLNGMHNALTRQIQRQAKQRQRHSDNEERKSESTCKVAFGQVAYPYIARMCAYCMCRNSSWRFCVWHWLSVSVLALPGSAPYSWMERAALFLRTVLYPYQAETWSTLFANARGRLASRLENFLPFLSFLPSSLFPSLPISAFFFSFLSFPCSGVPAPCSLLFCIPICVRLVRTGTGDASAAAWQRAQLATSRSRMISTRPFSWTCSSGPRTSFAQTARAKVNEENKSKEEKDTWRK